MDSKENNKAFAMAENSAISTGDMEIEQCAKSKTTNDTIDKQETSNLEENKVLQEIKLLKEDISSDDIATEMSLATTNSIELSQATTSQESSPTSSNVDCINDDSGISIEKSENSSEEDSKKLKHINENLSGKENIKSEDSEVNTEGENASATNNPKFQKLKSKVKKRNYRNKKNVNDTGDNSNDMIVDDSSSNLQEPNNSASTHEADQNQEGRTDTNSNGSDQEEGEAADEVNESTTEDESEEETVPVCLNKEQPKPNFFIVPNLIQREIGINSLLHRRYYGSLHVVQRLELMCKLYEHQGCVNTLHFNQKGNLLVSGSDDLTVVIWDWAIGKKHLHFDSGHKSNLFQTKWLPLDVEYLMVTCARDGQVRLLDLRNSSSRKLASHHGPSHKLAIHSDTPHVVLSVGEDAKVFSIDIRESKPNKLLVVKDGSSDIQLYTIHSNPLNSNEFCVGGRSQLVKVYDRRKVSTPLYDLCPDHLASNIHVHVTCAVYNYNGTEILASYNDEDIYLFDTVAPKRGDFAHRYHGHRNKNTVKGVNFFGPKSEFILSGSDCGNIFIWDKNTEAIVQWMPGDEQVVNHLEPHPHVPILATSGLDYDVKIWIPSSENNPTMTNLEKCIKYNLIYRKIDNANVPYMFDGEMLWLLLRHIRPTERVRQFIEGAHLRRRSSSLAYANDDDDDDDDEDDDEDADSDSEVEENETGRLHCPPS